MCWHCVLLFALIAYQQAHKSSSAQVCQQREVQTQSVRGRSGGRRPGRIKKLIRHLPLWSHLQLQTLCCHVRKKAAAVVPGRNRKWALVTHPRARKYWLSCRQRALTARLLFGAPLFRPLLVGRLKEATFKMLSYWEFSWKRLRKKPFGFLTFFPAFDVKDSSSLNWRRVEKKRGTCKRSF